MFLEYLACDTIYGVTKRQRGILVVSGIYGYNKGFTAMRYFMPSKETKAYNFPMRAALQYLVIDTTLSFIQYIACYH